jgi:hypothetical protein
MWSRLFLDEELRLHNVAVNGPSGTHQNHE